MLLEKIMFLIEFEIVFDKIVQNFLCLIKIIKKIVL